MDSVFKIFCVFFVILLLKFKSINAADTVWQNVGFNWTEPSSWVWINFGTNDPIPSRVFSQSDALLLYYDPNNAYSNPGFQGPIYTKQAYGNGQKAFYLEWTANDQSATVVELLSETLMSVGQFSSNNCWPNCGEFDVYEMLLAEGTTSVAYGASSNYGATTLHTGSRSQSCSCPARGQSQTWYQDSKPMTSACAAEWENRPNKVNSLVSIFDEDENGQFIQMIQDPIILHNGNQATISSGPNSVTTQKIYNNATSFYGNDPKTCPQGDPNVETGWPFYDQPMHLILWEQDYTAKSGTPGDTSGQFVVTNIQIYIGSGTTGSDFTPSSANGANSANIANTSKIANVVLVVLVMLAAFV